MRTYRRVQVTGGSTYIVSLPKEWVRLQGIERGSLVEVEVLPDGSLLIRPGESGGRGREKRVAVVSARDKKPAMIIREIVSLYVAGYDVIELSYSDRDYEAVAAARNVLSRILLGFDVLEEERGRTRFYVVLDEGSIGFWDAYSRMARTATSMLETLSEAVEKLDSRLASMVAERDDLVDKLYLLQSRQLTLALMGEESLEELGLTTYAEALHIFLAIKSIERIADHATLIAEAFQASPEPIAECNAAAILRAEAGLLRKASKLLEKPDPAAAHQLAEESGETRRATRKCKERGTGAEELRAYDSMERIAGYLQDIAEAAIDVISIRSKKERNRGRG